MNKPLGYKSYGSIPHLPGSRRGPGDHGISEQQGKILTERVRDKHDVVIVAEKVDGSCVSVARKEGQLLALGRAGYLAQTSPFEQHQLFAEWVRQNQGLFGWLPNNYRACGEWMIQAHGTRYNLNKEPFVVYDVMMGHKREPLSRWHLDDCSRFHGMAQMPCVPVLYIGTGSCSIEEALDLLGERGHFGAIDKAEGCVWRVEHNCEFNFIAKYVRPDKEDGKYLPEISGLPSVWNIKPEELFLRK